MPLHTKNIRLLIIDDDEDDYFIIADYIKSLRGLNVSADWCSDYKAALDHICSRKYDIYMMDYRLGARTGMDLLQEAMQKQCEEPIIMLTGVGNYEVDVQAMSIGAVDYLVKAELDSEKIERALRYALEQAETLRAVRASEKKYRNVFEKSKDIIFITNGDMVFTDINDTIYTLLGYSKEEAIGRMSLYDLVAAPEERIYLGDLLNEDAEVDDWEVELAAKNGDIRTCYLAATREQHTDGRVYFQGIIHDITNLKKSEKATLQAEKLALAGRLVQTMAHEIRNPLNNISLSMEQLQQEVGADAGIEPLVNIITRNVTRINDLIRELMNTARPSEIELQKTALQTVIDMAVAQVIDRATLKNVRMQLDYPEEPVYINANAQMLTIALLNMLVNATEAMEQDKGVLYIKVLLKDSLAILIIKDNGCGISKEDVSHLFEPYFTRKRNGVGLGLASTLNILQSHKAQVEVDSRQGEGTMFTISFARA